MSKTTTLGALAGAALAIAVALALSLPSVHRIPSGPIMANADYCINTRAEFSRAQADSGRSWPAALRLINHYQYCSTSDADFDRSMELLRDWADRGILPAMHNFAIDEFAMEESEPTSLRDRQDALRYLQRAAEFGYPASVDELRREVADLASDEILGLRLSGRLPPFPPIPAKFTAVDVTRLKGLCASSSDDDRQFCTAVFSKAAEIALGDAKCRADDISARASLVDHVDKIMHRFSATVWSLQTGAADAVRQAARAECS